MIEAHEDDRDRLAEMGIEALGWYEAENDGELVHVRIAHVSDDQRVVVAVIVSQVGSEKRRTKALFAKRTRSLGWVVITLGEPTVGRVIPALANALREARELHRNLPSTTVRPWTPGHE